MEHPVYEVEKRISFHSLELGRIVCICFLRHVPVGIKDGQAVNVDVDASGRFPKAFQEVRERLPALLLIREHKRPWRNSGMKFGLPNDLLCWLHVGFGDSPVL